MPSDRQVTSWQDEAINALVKAEQWTAATGDNAEALAHAVRGVGYALLHTAEKPAVKEMIDHCAETDHVLELRLIDTDVFGVRCSAPHCSFHTEWRT